MIDLLDPTARKNAPVRGSSSRVPNDEQETLDGRSASFSVLAHFTCPGDCWGGGGAPAPAHAGLIVSVQSVSANAGTSGNALEVDILNTGAAVDIASFSFEIAVSPTSGVTFTAADINTTLFTYIFAGNSVQGPVINTSTGAVLDASDNAPLGGQRPWGPIRHLAWERCFSTLRLRPQRAQ